MVIMIIDQGRSPIWSLFYLYAILNYKVAVLHAEFRSGIILALIKCEMAIKQFMQSI